MSHITFNLDLLINNTFDMIGSAGPDVGAVMTNK